MSSWQQAQFSFGPCTATTLAIAPGVFQRTSKGHDDGHEDAKQETRRRKGIIIITVILHTIIIIIIKKKKKKRIAAYTNTRTQFLLLLFVCLLLCLLDQAFSTQLWREKRINSMGSCST
mmetsp:Transcript_10250/g.15698  ORF Transcript_10250/g.15698 Transcript_10250/m.15698 type:complete len:119 (-) Transcript_10250:155-511(-)